MNFYKLKVEEGKEFGAQWLEGEDKKKLFTLADVGGAEAMRPKLDTDTKAEGSSSPAPAEGDPCAAAALQPREGSILSQGVMIVVGLAFWPFSQEEKRSSRNSFSLYCLYILLLSN